MKEGNPEHAPAAAHAATLARQELAVLAARGAQGDAAALVALQRRLHDGLVRWFARTWPRDTERHERLANETWVEVWHALRDGRYDARRAAISTFAFAIASNLRLRELRSSGRVSTSLLDDQTQATQLSDATDVLAHASTLEALRHLLRDPGGGLDESDRGVLALVARGMGDREIARELGVSPSTGHERKKRALVRVGIILRSQGHLVSEDATIEAGEEPRRQGAGA